MKYLLLAYHDEKKIQAMSRRELDAVVDETLANNEELRKSGHLIAAEALYPVQTARTVRVYKGQSSITDGPFAETKEQLGGFFLINARDLDEAVQVASKMVQARLGSFEIRPIWDLLDPPPWG